GKEAHARRNPHNNSVSTRIIQVHHFPIQNGVTRLVPTVRTAAPTAARLTMASHTSSIGAISFAAIGWEVTASLSLLAAIRFHLAQQRAESH
ncbi:MAG: hypothetical protein ACYCSN_16050, partial [Acidobacteriaceae bacterium]